MLGFATTALPVRAQSAAAPSAAAATTAEAQADAGPRFDIWEYEVTGNTVLPALSIEGAVLPHLGPGRSMNDVEAARAALEAVYQKAGYLTVFVDVPEQQVDGGVVRLAVLEGRVGRLHVTGSQYHSTGQIRKQVTEVAEGSVPDFNRMQQQLAAVAKPDELSVQPLLKPGRLPGTLDVELQVDDKLPLSAAFELNNEHPRDTDPLRASANVRWNNMFQLGHALSLTGITAPTDPSQSRIFVANYSVPLDAGRMLSGYYVNSDSAVDTLGGTTALGKGQTLGLRYSVPFGSDAGAVHSLTAGLDYKDLQERTRFGAEEDSTPVRYLPMQLAWQSQFNDGAVRTQLDGTFLWTFEPLLQRDVSCPSVTGDPDTSDQFACKRAGADGGFAVLRLDVRHQRPLGDFGLALRVAAQGAAEPLVSAEQFSIGGAQSVRGYLESEATGDHGMLGSIELSTPAWGVADHQLRALAFADAGRVRTIDALPGQAAVTSLLGVGMGLRVSASYGLDGSLDVASPQKRTTTSDSDSVRVHVRLGMKL